MVIANIDLIMDWCVLDPSVRGLVVAIGRPLSDISPGKLIFPYEQPPVLRELFHYSPYEIDVPGRTVRGNNCVLKYGKIHGVIRRHSGLPNCVNRFRVYFIPVC